MCEHVEECEYVLENEDGIEQVVVPKWLYDHVVELESYAMCVHKLPAHCTKTPIPETPVGELLMGLGVIRELTGTSHDDLFDTISVVRDQQDALRVARSFLLEGQHKAALAYIEATIRREA